jgi:hypothetical protein
MKITVKKEHIATATERDSHCCMIADALKERFPRAQYVLVDLQSIRFSDPKTRRRFIFLTPPVAQIALLRFDRGDRTLPGFTFRLVRPLMRDMGWQGQRSASASRKDKRYQRTGRKRNIVAYKERKFGLRVFTGVEL